MIFQFITTNTIQSGQFRTFDSVNSVGSVWEYIGIVNYKQIMFFRYSVCNLCRKQTDAETEVGGGKK